MLCRIYPLYISSHKGSQFCDFAFQNEINLSTLPLGILTAPAITPVPRQCVVRLESELDVQYKATQMSLRHMNRTWGAVNTFPSTFLGRLCLGKSQIEEREEVYKLIDHFDSLLAVSRTSPHDARLS